MTREVTNEENRLLEWLRRMKATDRQTAYAIPGLSLEAIALLCLTLLHGATEDTVRIALDRTSGDDFALYAALPKANGETGLQPGDVSRPRAVAAIHGVNRLPCRE